MGLEKLEKLAKLVLTDLLDIVEDGYGSYTLQQYSATEVKFRNLLNVASKNLPEHAELFTSTYKKIEDPYHYGEISVYATKMLVEHLIELIQLEKTSEMKIREMKIFESAEEKIKQANLSFGKDDYSSVFHNLNTALELILKDKCGIPTAITAINTSNVIDLLVKYKVEPYAHFSESRKRVTDLANRVKHQAYVPSKKEAILGIKAMEELVSKLRDKEIELTEEIKDKIFQGL